MAALGVVPALFLFAEGAGARAPEAPPSHFRFVDVAPEVGLTRVVLAGRPLKDHLLDSAGTGAAWLDYDRDGRLDCYIVNDWLIEGDRVTERGKNALYRQKADGTFEDVTDAAGVGGEGHWGAGVFVADYDRDGWPDLLVTNFGPNVLYRNRGDGTFANVAAEVGLESPGWNTGAAWFDADGDGDLDVYIAAYIDNSLEQILAAKPTLPWRGMAKVAVGPFGLEGGADHYFRNDGGRFVDATLEAGMEDKGLGFGFSVRAADFDRDGDLDVYVANDSDPNYLYRNEGDGTFQEVATWTGSGLDENGAAQASMGVAVGDATGNGELDIFVNHFSEDFSTLWQGLGGGLFEDVSRKTGVGTGDLHHPGLGHRLLRPRQRRGPRDPGHERAHLPPAQRPPGAHRDLRAEEHPPGQPGPRRLAHVRGRDRRRRPRLRAGPVEPGARHGATTTTTATWTC